MSKRAVARLVALAGLAGTIVPPLLYLAGRSGLGAAQGWMLGATLLWFAAAPLWLGERER